MRQKLEQLAQKESKFVEERLKSQVIQMMESAHQELFSRYHEGGISSVPNLSPPSIGTGQSSMFSTEHEIANVHSPDQGGATKMLGCNCFSTGLHQCSCGGFQLQEQKEATQHIDWKDSLAHESLDVSWANLTSYEAYKDYSERIISMKEQEITASSPDHGYLNSAQYAGVIPGKVLKGDFVLAPDVRRQHIQDAPIWQNHSSSILDEYDGVSSHGQATSPEDFPSSTSTSLILSRNGSQLPTSGSRDYPPLQRLQRSDYKMAASQAGFELINSSEDLANILSEDLKSVMDWWREI
jgi:hypothetical protein